MRRTIIRLAIISMLLISCSVCADFEYEWIADDTYKGKETFTPVEPLKVQLLDQEIQLVDSSAALVLQRTYNVYLNEYWTDDEAHIVLNAFHQLYPSSVRFLSDWEKSVWIKFPIEQPEDVSMQDIRGELVVAVSVSAIKDSQTMIAKVEGIKGKLFSKRMHRVVLQYLYYLHGSDMLENILLDRFGVKVRPSQIPYYEELTKGTTGETSARFERFKDQELIYLINILEEVPDGMIKTPGLKYLLRRKDGLTHPLYPLAPAVAWTGSGYIEFMSSAFKDMSREYIYRLILHEKAHFLWSHLFDHQLKQDWIELGGWFEDSNDPNGWSTTDKTRFVSDYAHNVNPNEDMAESISFYIVNPDKLRTNAPEKYKFIQDRIMHGTRYISKIREDLAFKVYNLYPDYTYPARVKRIYVKITGEPEEDKKVHVEIEINSEDGLDDAQTAYIRMFNDIYMHDLAYLSTKDGKVLVYEGAISKYRKSGYWYCAWLSITDQSGNKRLTEPPNIGWKFYLDNPLEDVEYPKYVKDSCSIEIADIEKTEFGNKYNVEVTWKVTDNNDHIRLPQVDVRIDDPHPDKSYKASQGYYNIDTNIASVIIPIYDYDSNGIWDLSQISMTDIAGNVTNIYVDELNLSVFIDTQTPDYEGVEIKTSVGDITITATPTNKEYPNGETIVDIYFYAKDKASGLYHIRTSLRDPLGRTHIFGKYFYERQGIGAWHQYHQKILLPKGSAPGIWGLIDIHTTDYARNQATFDFTTLARFEVDKSESAAPGITTTKLLQNYPNPCNPETWIPYTLATASNLYVYIYNVEGKMIRKIDVGFTNPGRYINKENSIYWDGMNENSERVAAGVYFYTLETDQATHTRKMIIEK